MSQKDVPHHRSDAQVLETDPSLNPTNSRNEDIESQGDIVIDVEHIPRRYIWRSCCLILDSRAVLFFSQLAISIVIMLFCIRQMVVLEDTDAQKNYGILLSFMIGLWFPAPKIGA